MALPEDLDVEASYCYPVLLAVCTAIQNPGADKAADHGGINHIIRPHSSMTGTNPSSAQDTQLTGNRLGLCDFPTPYIDWIWAQRPPDGFQIPPRSDMARLPVEISYSYAPPFRIPPTHSRQLTICQAPWVRGDSICQTIRHLDSIVGDTVMVPILDCILETGDLLLGL
jgi:hypothetical protein